MNKEGVVDDGIHGDSHGIRDKTKRKNVCDSIRVVPDCSETCKVANHINFYYAGVTADASKCTIWSWSCIC